MGELGRQIDEGWFAKALDDLGDLVIVIAADTSIIWANQAVEVMLGYCRDDYMGQSIAQFLHPDDLGRAAEVVTLVDDGRFYAEAVSPALYRVRHRNGEWVHLELNSSSRSGAEGEKVLIGRFAGDLVFGDQLLEAVTAGAPLHQQIDLVRRLGAWRYPREGYIIHYMNQGEVQNACSPGLPPELSGVIDLGDAAPWKLAMKTKFEVSIADLSLPESIGAALSADLAAAALSAGYRGCLAVPVSDPTYEQGSCIVIWTRNSGPSVAGHRYAMANMCRSLMLVLHQRSIVAQLEEAAFVDELTGVSRRVRFLDQLREADERSNPESRHVLLYLDLDKFKAVNDRYGHSVGDRVLSIAAKRIADALPDDAVFGRIGGDEFAVLCPAGWGRDQAEGLANDILGQLHDPLVIGNREIQTGVTIGLAVGDPGQMAAEVLAIADADLIGAKSQLRIAGEGVGVKPLTP